MKKTIACSFIAILLFMIIFSMNKMSYAYLKSDNSSSNATSNSASSSNKKNANEALKEEKNVPKIVGISLASGAIFSSLVCGIIVSKHKPVKVARAANNYLDKNKVSITRREDFFVRSTTDKQAK